MRTTLYRRDEVQNVTDNASPDAQEQAAGASFVRTCLVLPLWVVRLLVQGTANRPPQIETIALDILLLGLHVWAVLPLYRHETNRFPDRRYMSAHLFTPVVLAAFFVVRDVWFFLADRSL